MIYVHIYLYGRVSCARVNIIYKGLTNEQIQKDQQYTLLHSSRRFYTVRPNSCRSKNNRYRTLHSSFRIDGARYKNRIIDIRRPTHSRGGVQSADRRHGYIRGR